MDASVDDGSNMKRKRAAAAQIDALLGTSSSSSSSSSRTSAALAAGQDESAQQRAQQHLNHKKAKKNENAEAATAAATAAPSPAPAPAAASSSSSSAATSSSASFETQMDRVQSPNNTQPLPLHATANQQSHGWNLLSGSLDRTARVLATSWLGVANGSDMTQWELKRGGFWQHATDDHGHLLASAGASSSSVTNDERLAKLRQRSETWARSVLRAVGVNAQQLHMGDVKLMQSLPGEGLQEVHFDVTTHERAKKCYTLLLYLTPTLSTCFPRETLQELDPPALFQLTPAAAKKRLPREAFYSARVAPGDHSVLNCAVPHFAPANPSADKAIRHVAFFHFYPRHTPAVDTEDQYYPRGVKK